MRIQRLCHHRSITPGYYPPKTLADLTIADLTPGKESAGLLSLVALVAILGWMILRERDDEELDAMEMVKKYDVDEVEARRASRDGSA